MTNYHLLKIKAADGKMRITDVADPETLFRLIQSIPSKKAEPFKLWLARVGNERIEEISDPEQSLNRARDNWKKHGRSQNWICAQKSAIFSKNDPCKIMALSFLRFAWFALTNRFSPIFIPSLIFK